MAESTREAPQSVIEAERTREDNRHSRPGDRNQERTSPLAPEGSGRLADLGQQGARQAAEATTAAASGAQHSGFATAACAQEIAAAWARYAEEVTRHTSEASQALLRARTFSEILDLQAKLLRDNMQAFLDQTAKIAESASRMATQPLEALKEATSGQNRR